MYSVIYIARCRSRGVFGHIQNGLAVDLQGRETVKFHGDFLASMYRYHIFVFNMLTLENAGEYTQRSEPACAVEQHQ